MEWATWKKANEPNKRFLKTYRISDGDYCQLPYWGHHFNEQKCVRNIVHEGL